MDTAVTFGGFFIVWGMFYWMFAFIGKESGIANSLFKVPAIFIFLPDRMVLSVGRVLTGALCIGFGVFFILYMAQATATP